MRKTLYQLQKESQLMLPKGAWGGSYSGADALYSGDDTKLTFVRAERIGEAGTVCMTAKLDGGSEVKGYIQEVEEDGLDVEALIAAINKHVGERVSDLYHQELDL